VAATGRVVLFCAGVGGLPRPDPFLCRITALMVSMVVGADMNPADQRWNFWPLLPLSTTCSQ